MTPVLQLEFQSNTKEKCGFQRDVETRWIFMCQFKFISLHFKAWGELPRHAMLSSLLRKRKTYQLLFESYGESLPPLGKKYHVLTTSTLIRSKVGVRKILLRS